MDGTSGSQNNQNGGEKKPQLSWSQPVTTSLQKTSAPQSPASKAPSSQAAPVSEQKNNTFRNAVITVLLLAVVGIVAMVLISRKHDDADTTVVPASTTPTATPGTNGVQPGTSIMAGGAFSVASPQAAGLHVAISNISVTVPTWVVIYENHNGQPGNVLGAGLFMSGNTSGTVDLLRGTLPGQTYFVGQARDDGDHMFSMTNDPATRDTNGNPLWVQFTTN